MNDNAVNKPNDDELDFLTTEDLAKLLSVSVDWLNHNRLSDNPIPYKKLSKFVRYSRRDVAAWMHAQTEGKG